MFNVRRLCLEIGVTCLERGAQLKGRLGEAS